MRNTISICAILAAGLLGVQTVQASLIGTEIDVSYVNDGNSGGNAATSVIVQAGGGDAFQFGFGGIDGFTIDIEDDSVVMTCTGGFCNTNPDLGPVHYVFEGVDWGGTGILTVVALDAASDCSLCGASVALLSDTSFEVLLPNNANPGLGDTLIVNLTARHVPEPHALLLLGGGLLVLTANARARRRAGRGLRAV